MEEIKIKFDRKIQITGNGKSINLPEPIINQLKWDKGTKVKVMLDTNKRNQIFISIFKED